MSKFPLIENLGLKLVQAGCGYQHDCVNAHDVEKLLSEGVEVFTATEKAWMTDHPEPEKSGLLINIQPIAPKDTAESLLREMVEKWSTRVPSDWYDRAKKLVGGG